MAPPRPTPRRCSCSRPAPMSGGGCPPGHCRAPQAAPRLRSRCTCSRGAGSRSRRRPGARRPLTNTSRTRPSRCPMSRGRCISPTGRPGSAGSSTISVSSVTAPMCSRTSLSRSSAPLHIGGAPLVNLFASTSGTDSDWVVKLIDVYPEEVPSDPPDGGLSAADRHGHLPRPLPREPRAPERHCLEQGAALPLRPAHGRSRVPAGASGDGADPVELVSALRPQPADLCR